MSDYRDDARTHEDAFNILCGQLLGMGIHRKVFACRLDPTLVVKVEISGDWRTFANVVEMNFWRDHGSDEKVGKWLAPCEHISPDGRILLQKRCATVQRSDLPEQMPGFLRDFKPENFGMYEGRLVCVDYAYHELKPSVKLSKVHWA